MVRVKQTDVKLGFGADIRAFDRLLLLQFLQLEDVIFEVADLGIVGNVNTLLPKLAAAIKQYKEEA